MASGLVKDHCSGKLSEFKRYQTKNIRIFSIRFN